MNVIGYFDKTGQPRVSLTVKGLRRSFRIDPVVDSGFDGQLCLPNELAIQLGLELKGKTYVELADGSRKFELSFQGSVIWQGREQVAKIFLTDSEDALLGSDLMQGQKLCIDYTNREVALSPSPKKKSKRKNR